MKIKGFHKYKKIFIYKKYYLLIKFLIYSDWKKKLYTNLVKNEKSKKKFLPE